jgi:hypothetical protein
MLREGRIDSNISCNCITGRPAYVWSGEIGF